MELDWAKGDVILLDGQEVANAARSWFRERAEVQIGPELWQYRSEGFGRGTLVAELDGVARFSARRSGFFTSTWTVDAGQPLELRQAGWFGSRLSLSRAGTTIGEASTSGIFTTRPRLVLSEPVEARAGCFVLWVAYVEFTRRQSSASSSSGGATG
ncbi:hypothetical protein [Nocardioides hwasunensis]|uniref:DUF1990 domain-containing protein n=1 Tax=Nocardioides hwasunensis TaxID=397258 RepID=A0ABR8MEM6_9ACTN|nr:hypothetical protein [Nocardioides hwasunensis]MBD3914561.1 hypothetical protein [Nocardioides hwasunensis]